MIEQAGGFGWRQLERAGLAPTAIRLSRGDLLSHDELAALEGVSLPVIGKLLETAPGRFLPLSAAPAAIIRPLLYLPLAEWTEKSEEPLAGRMNRLLESIATCRSAHGGLPQIFVVPDSWVLPGRPLPALFDCLREIFSAANAELRILGPSTRDLKEMMTASGADPESEPAIRAFLQELLVPELRSIGGETIFGGTSLRIHRIAAELGLANFVAHDLNKLRLGLNHPLSGAFGGHLQALRRELLTPGSPSKLLGWMPLFRSVLDRTPTARPGGSAVNGGSGSDPLGLEALKAVAIARLALPEVRYIQAPLALFGHKSADVALRFGANDLGFAAINDESARRLELPTIDQAVELFSTTPVKLHFSEEST